MRNTSLFDRFRLSPFSKGLLLSVVALMLVCTLCACGDDEGGETRVSVSGSSLISEGQLTIAADFDSALLTEGDGHPNGYEYELMTALCEQMKLEPVWVDTPQTDLFAAVGEKKAADVAISGIPVDSAGEESISFSEPYAFSILGFYELTDGAIDSMEQVDGMLVGVMKGSYAETWAKKNMADATLVEFTDSDGLFAAVRAKVIDGAICDRSMSANHTGYWEEYTYYGLEIRYGDTEVAELDSVTTDTKYAIAVNSRNGSMVRALNDAMNNLRVNGTFDELYTKYFGKSAPTVYTVATEEEAEE